MRFTFSLFFILASFSSLLAQTGSVRGTILGEIAEIPLPGATVSIAEQNIGTITDVNGNFLLRNIPAGEQVLQIRYLGYKEIDTTLVVEKGKTIEFNLGIVEDIVFLSEISVVTQRVGQNAAINQQVNSDNIINVVSAERMSELPDANVGESIARLPGISVTRSDGEANGIIVRGLQPSFNRVQIAGVDIPGTADNRSVGVGGISSEALGGVEVYKAVTPDMNPESTGGTVNMQLAKARDKKMLYVKGGGFYSNDDFNQYKVSTKYSQRFFDSKLGFQLTANAERRNRDRSVGKATYTTSDSEYDPNNPGFWADYPPDLGTFTDTTGSLRGHTYAYEFGTGDIIDSRVVKEKQGANISLDYKWDHHSVVLSSFYNRTNTEKKEIINEDLAVRGNYSQPRSNTFTNLLQTEHNFRFFEVNTTFSYASSSSKVDKNYSTKFLQNFGGIDTTLVPSSLVDADRLEYLPFEQRYRATPYEEAPLNYITNDFSDKKSTNWSAKVDIKIPFRLGGSFDGFIKLGGQYKSSRRNNTINTNKLILRDAWTATGVGIDSVRVSDWTEQGYHPNIYFGEDEYPVRYVLDPTRGPEYWESIHDQLDSAGIDNFAPYDGKNQSFESIEETYAGYLMAKLNFRDYITLTPGFRYETDHNTLTGYDRFVVQAYPGNSGEISSVTVKNQWDYFLPMMHLQIKPTSWANLRLAYTNTITRPDYQLRIPKRNNTAGAGDLYDGNPYLKTARATNYDAMLSLYKGRFGLISGGVFYKEIRDLPYTHQEYFASGMTEDSLNSMGIHMTHGTITDYMQVNYQQPRNLPDVSTLKGYEIEIQPNLSFLPGILNGLVLSANYTRTWSESYFVRHLLTSDFNIDPVTYRPVITYDLETTKTKIRTPKQADRLLNISVGYEYKMVALRWSMYHMGEYLDYLNPSADAIDKYIDPITKHDLSLNVHLMDKRLTLFLNVQNLFAVADQSAIGNGAWTRYQEYQVTPTSYELSLKYNIF